MLIANPLYDGAFKYLLDDNRIAKIFLSALLGQDITKLTFRPTEFRFEHETRSFTVFHIDFAASIVQPDGSEKLIIIEIQKAKYSTDILRFRKYLGHQYANKENTYTDKDGTSRAMPIMSIYFLGHRLAKTNEPIIRIQRQYTNHEGKHITSKEDFIESLTHDSLIVQIPHLKRRRQNDLEALLAIFDQTQKLKDDDHSLSIDEASFPEKFRPVVRRLAKAIAEPTVRDQMNIEDNYFEEYEETERKLAKKDEVLAEERRLKEAAETLAAEERRQKEEERRQKEDALTAKEEERRQKEEALATLAAKDAALQSALATLIANGIPEPQARKSLGLD